MKTLHTSNAKKRAGRGTYYSVNMANSSPGAGTSNWSHYSPNACAGINITSTSLHAAGVSPGLGIAASA